MNESLCRDDIRKFLERELGGSVGFAITLKSEAGVTPVVYEMMRGEKFSSGTVLLTFYPLRIIRRREHAPAMSIIRAITTGVRFVDPDLKREIRQWSCPWCMGYHDEADAVCPDLKAEKSQLKVA